MARIQLQKNHILIFELRYICNYGKKCILTFLCFHISSCGILFLKKQAILSNNLLAKLSIPYAFGKSQEKGKILFSSEIISIYEGEEQLLGIRLTSSPSDSVQIRVESKETGLSLNNNNSANLTFSPSNYSVEQKIRLKAITSATDSEKTIQLEASASGYENTSISVKVIALIGQTVLFSNCVGNILEGTSGSCKVSLSRNLSSQIIVNFSSSDSSTMTVSPTQMIFTSDNYLSEQILTLNAIEDSDATSESLCISATSFGLADSSVNINTIDNDIGIVFTGANSISEGTGMSLFVQLEGNPGSDRIVSFQVSDTNLLTVTPNPIVFNSSNWNSPQILTIQSIEDSQTGNKNITINASGQNLKSIAHTLTVIDNDTQNILFTGNATVAESSSGILGIKLSQMPSGVVTINLSSSNPDIALTPSSLSFSPIHFTNGRTVSYAINSDTDEDSESSIITASLGTITNTYAINIIDKDTRILFSSAPNGIKEGSASSFQVKLSGNPGMNRTINFSSDKTSLIANGSMNFSTTDYSTNQTLSISATEPDSDSDSELATISASSVTIANLPNLINGTQSIPVIDNDTQMIFSGVTSFYKSAPATIYLKLNGNPYTSRTINIVSADTTRLTVNPATLTFDISNYSINQAITITGIGLDIIDQTVGVNASGGADSLTGQTVPSATHIVTIQVNLVATPTFSPIPTYYNTPTYITISSTTPGATIYYTLDGSTPTTSSTQYTSPIHIWSVAGRVLKAIGAKAGYGNSYVATAGNYSYPPLKTGQTQCYDASYNLVACSATYKGQDGYEQQGVSRSYTGPTQHSIYTNDYTTKDNYTGLVWKTCSQGLSGATCASGTAIMMDWTSAQSGVNGCNALNTVNGGNGYAGIGTWRLPGIQELSTLIDSGRITSPSINILMYPSMINNFYWSSTNNIFFSQ